MQWRSSSGGLAFKLEDEYLILLAVFLLGREMRRLLLTAVTMLVTVGEGPVA